MPERRHSFLYTTFYKPGSFLSNTKPVNYRLLQREPTNVKRLDVYQDVWQPSVGEVLLLQREPTNVKDNQAVCVMKSTLVVGHIPQNFSLAY